MASNGSEFTSNASLISVGLQDTASLVLVFVRHRGYIVLAEAAGPVQEGEENASTDVDVDDLPDGGANALNVNR